MKKVLSVSIFISLLILFSGFSGSVFQEKWTAPKAADKINNPLKGNSASINKGKIIYNQLCFVCHGTKGKGDGIGAAALKPKPANLTSSAVRSESDGAIFWKLSTGRPPMASYKEILSDEKKWDVINYMRTFK